MPEHTRVSMEFLAIGATTHLPVELLGVVERLFAVAKSTPLTESHLSDIAGVVKRTTGINLVARAGAGRLTLQVYCQSFGGHGALDRSHHGKKSAAITNNTDTQWLKATVDLTRVRVTGLFSQLPAALFISPAFFAPDSNYTPEEVVAMILHEVGHVFSTYALVGEYVWLNYYLTDGIEIALGKKPNTYRVELLNHTKLQAELTALDERGLAEELKQPTAANLRRAFIAVAGKRRHSSFASTPGFAELPRSEQLADLFVSRLGYGRALVTGLDKYQREWSGNAAFWDPSTHVTVEVVKLLLLGIGVAVSPYVLFALLLGVFYKGRTNTLYDTVQERHHKLRRDLIAQLRNPATTPALREVLLSDVDAIDRVVAYTHEHRTVLELLSTALNPVYRRKQQGLKAEQQLEALLNSDLFLHSNQLKHLAS